ncbi:hypothetical protein ACFWR6_07190 [Streptomyces griseus]|uniref:hypothetical protein n=1 Tax=Streptomyces griseus TaxID=1911 RepID=UPI00365ACFA1
MYGDTWEAGVDLVAVERAVSERGGCPELQPAEVLRAIEIMTGLGRSEKVIAKRLGLSVRTVTRRRADMGLMS